VCRKLEGLGRLAALSPVCLAVDLSGVLTMRWVRVGVGATRSEITPSWVD
jgi:hypothetical protein